MGRGEGTCPNGGFEGKGPREGAAPVHPHTRWGGRPRRGPLRQDAEPAVGPAGAERARRPWRTPCPGREGGRCSPRLPGTCPVGEGGSGPGARGLGWGAGRLPDSLIASLLTSCSVLRPQLANWPGEVKRLQEDRALGAGALLA